MGALVNWMSVQLFLFIVAPYNLIQFWTKHSQKRKYICTFIDFRNNLDCELNSSQKGAIKMKSRSGVKTKRKNQVVGEKYTGLVWKLNGFPISGFFHWNFYSGLTRKVLPKRESHRFPAPLVGSQTMFCSNVDNFADPETICKLVTSCETWRRLIFKVKCVVDYGLYSISNYS